MYINVILNLHAHLLLLRTYLKTFSSQLDCKLVMTLPSFIILYDFSIFFRRDSIKLFFFFS